MGEPFDSWDDDVEVLVIGDVMLDRYTSGTVHRISPEAPVPVVVKEAEFAVLGGAGNAASNVAALGARVSLVGTVGTDHAAEELCAAAVAAGIDVSGLLPTDGPTSVKHRIVATGQQIVRVDVDASAPIDRAAAKGLIAGCVQRLGAADVVLISDYAKGTCSAPICRAVIRAARNAGRPVVVDPKARRFATYRGATVVTPNLSEALNAQESKGLDVDAIGGSLVRCVDGHILLTQGPGGMTLYGPLDSPVHLPPKARHVYDVTGAGDTVAATVAVALAHRVPLLDACRLANEAAALAVSRHGTTAVTLAELMASVLG